MKKTTIICDRCGKEITNGKVYQLATFISDPGKSWDLGDEVDTESGADLCADCYKIVDDAVAAAMKPKPVANKIELDMGYVHALKDPGWLFSEIAKEIGVSERTIRNRLKEDENHD